MAERLKRAAAWLGLVTDDRYAEYDDATNRRSSPRASAARSCSARSRRSRRSGAPAGPEKAASVTPLETRRSRRVHCDNVHPARLSPTDG